MSLRIDKSSVVCVEAEIIGDVRIGQRSVIHPKVCLYEIMLAERFIIYLKARIIAEHGPIIIGNDNLIEEAVLIKNSRPETLHIGNENIFEVQSQFTGNSFYITSMF